jgi:hypothetical protein
MFHPMGSGVGSGEDVISFGNSTGTFSLTFTRAQAKKNMTQKK